MDRKSSLERMLDILLEFANAGGELSFEEIQKMSCASRSTAYRYLQVLREYDLVEEDAEVSRYRLGSSVTRLARVQFYEKRFVDQTHPIMQALALQTGETTVLAHRSGDRIVVLDSVNSEKTLRVSIQAADNLPIHQGSFGKLYLALQANQLKANAVAVRKLGGSASSNAAFKELLRSISRLNYATSIGEVEKGAASISVPVVTSKGDMFAALAVAGPAVRMSATKMKSFLPAMTSASREISLILSSGRMRTRAATSRK